MSYTVDSMTYTDNYNQTNTATDTETDTATSGKQKITKTVSFHSSSCPTNPRKVYNGKYQQNILSKPC